MNTKYIYKVHTYYTKVITLKCSRQMMALHCKFHPECNLKVSNFQKCLRGIFPSPFALAYFA